MTMTDDFRQVKRYCKYRKQVKRATAELLQQYDVVVPDLSQWPPVTKGKDEGTYVWNVKNNN